jgi:hypothetical protein
MVNTTQTYWDINGVSLNTYSWNISTLGGGRLSTPEYRGENIEVPYRRGEVYLPKIADKRDITLAVWISAMDEDGLPPADGNIEAAWQANYDTLRRLFWNETEELVLTKRFWRDGSVVSASANVELTRGLEPTIDAPGLGRMTVGLNMADPFFYGDEVEVVMAADSTTTVAVAGDAITYNIILDMDGGAELVNTTPSPDLSVSVSVDAQLDVRNKKVNNLAIPALVTTVGSDQWFKLFPGNNALACHNEAVTITYRPAYF